MPYQFNVDVVGTKGTIRDNRLWSETMLPGQTSWSDDPDDPARLRRRHPPPVQRPDRGVRGGDPRRAEPVLPDLDDAVKTHEIIFAADRSAETGKPVRLPLGR